MIVKREQELALDVVEPLLQCQEIFFRKVELIQLPLPVRRIKVEASRRTVVLFKNLFVGQALDLYPLQSLVCLPEDVGDARGVVVRGLGHAVMEGLPHYQPAEGVFLKVEESSGALNVGERCRVGPRLKLVQLAAGRPISQVADQFFVVPLAYPEEVDDLAVAVVENLNARWL